MLRRNTWTVLSALALVLTGPAFAEPDGVLINIGAGPLPNGLQALVRQTGIELLFDPDVVEGIRAPAVSGSLSTEEALLRMLAESNLTVRRASSGAWVIEPMDAAPLEQPDAAVPEVIVVTGRAVQNADIRRTEKDVQPYVVTTRAELVSAHRDNIGQFISSRITSSTQVPDTGLIGGEITASSIDLRGLGRENTLVLVDGRRMPTTTGGATAFGQADLNSIPLHAIERIETLTGAAGGIHGFGALGGVVNIILDRDTRGLDLYLTQGISSRGDARHQSIEASYGYTSEDGGTDVSVFGSLSKSDPLFAGQRGYVYRDRQELFASSEDEYWRTSPYGNSITVQSLLGSDLVFKPEYGGSVLPSSYTYLPTGFSGTTSDLAASLTEHSGQMDFSLAQGDALTDLGTRPETSALLGNLHHAFSEDLEIYLDVVLLRANGEHHDRRTSNGTGALAFLSPDSPANPFDDYVVLTIPLDQQDLSVSQRTQATRYTAGAVMAFPFDWRAAAEVNLGGYRETRYIYSQFDLVGLTLFGDPSDLDTNPFGDWAAFQRAVTANPWIMASRYAYRTEFNDQSLRLAGPVFNAGAGPSTLTLLAERKQEHRPAYTSTRIDVVDGEMTEWAFPESARSATTFSLYAELRSRLFGEDAGPWPLRGLEVQLAVRRDEQNVDFDAGGPNLQRVNFDGTAYTAGAKVSPTSWLTLRGSYATGKQPLSLTAFVPRPDEVRTESNISDPKRGGESLGTGGEFVYRRRDLASMKMIKADTIFLGAILTPFGEDGASLGFDFSRIDRKNDLLFLSDQTVLAHEDYWPQRVVRTPLTDEDRAKGYTAGRVILFDVHEANGAGQKVDAYDMRAEWPMDLASGRLRLYADATYHKRNSSTQLFEPDEQRAGYLGQPLKWRANGGFDWSIEDLTVGANVQYFGSYLAYEPGSPDSSKEYYTLLQGSHRIPSQTYVDFHARWRLPIPDAGVLREATMDFGVVNVFDKAPPKESRQIGLNLVDGQGYSLYGDPRQRRFEVTLSSAF